MTTPDKRARWVKSSYSTNGGDCVEAAVLDGLGLIRDSKDPDGPAIGLEPEAWAQLLHCLKIGNAPRS
ncbi:DUF397 domain-containing protein [Actinomadura rupiterrae]|uniref:DUF397 domain-containing protein n=1 Tax=Actinomadura rupiterrae TaxID=559627 RepID=UPI0020A4DEB3|nr:DUF397 domain-containing protein [Actinomadura rupiterrae]MCP2337521.1 hypothetical protein [Actinomadura rupiterrae]